MNEIDITIDYSEIKAEFDLFRRYAGMLTAKSDKDWWADHMDRYGASDLFDLHFSGGVLRVLPSRTIKECTLGILVTVLTRINWHTDDSALLADFQERSGVTLRFIE